MLKTVSDAASWLLRTLLVDATGAWLFMAVFAAGTLLYLPEIESGLAAQKPGWWLEVVKPAAWATITVAVWILGVPTAVRLRVKLSPTYRFRQLARRADALAAELSDDRNYYPAWVDFEEGLPSLPPPRRARPRLEAVIATFKVNLSTLGVRRTPPANDVGGWQRAVPALRALIDLGALSDACDHDWTADS